MLPNHEKIQAAVAAARMYLQTRKKAESPDTTLQPIKYKNGDEVIRATKIGNERSHLS